MHALIGFLVEGEDKDSAYTTVYEYLADLATGNCRGMEYFTLLADDSKLAKSWDITEPIFVVDDKKHKDEVDGMIQINKENFEKNLKKAIELYNQQAEGWEVNALYNLRMASCSFYGGVFFNYTDPIISWAQIDKLKKYTDPDEKLYVVYADIHQ